MAIPSVSPVSQPMIAPAPPLAEPLLQDAAVTVTASADAQKSAMGGDKAASGDPRPSQGDAQPAPTLEKAIEELNRSFEAWSTRLRFEMDPEAQRLVVTVLDSETGDTIRTIPSDAVIRVAKMIVNLQGQLVKTQA